MAIRSTMLCRYPAAVMVRWHSSITIRSSFCREMSDRAYLEKSRVAAASAVTNASPDSFFSLLVSILYGRRGAREADEADLRGARLEGRQVS